MAVERIRVEVVFAEAARQQVVALELPAGVSLRHAIERSRLLEPLSPVAVAVLSYGIFGVVATPATLLTDGDRVEIYRPLHDDPKAIRRQRARARAPRPKRVLSGRSDP